MQVFISHASKDVPIARRLAHRLTEAGLKPWIVNDEVFPGDNIPKRVGEALEESDLMVVLVTPHAFESDRLKEEIQYAMTAGQFKGRIIPVFLDSESEKGADVPWILRKLDAVQMEGRQEDWDQVVDKVRTLTE